MSDYIEREAAFQYSVVIDGHRVVPFPDILAIPAVDAVPVVRCVECYKRYKSWCPLYGGHMGSDMDDDFYCKFGKRREIDVSN